MSVSASIRPIAKRHNFTHENLFRTSLAFLIVLYLLAWAFTGAHFMADTNVYTQAILRHQHGLRSVDYHLDTSNPFWDFGHLLWRPFGWVCFVAARPITGMLSHHNERAEVLLTLIAINWVAALGCVIFFFLLARRILGGSGSALLASIVFCTADAFLNYAHSGNAYVVGLACLVAGMYLSICDKLKDSSVARALFAGQMYALAVLFWFPYVFVIPAALALPATIWGHDKEHLHSTRHTLVMSVLVGLLAYLWVATQMGIRTPGDFRDWALAAGHGQIQPGGLRALARVAFAVPRSFVNMDRDGMWLKRYLVHDPYAPITTIGLLRLSLWKLLLFYIVVGVICIELWRSEGGRRLFLVLAAAVVPILLFAVFIFESGSIERYLPLYPFVFLAWGWVLSSERSTRISKFLLVLTLAAAVFVNLSAMRRTRLQAQKAETIARIHDLVPLVGPNSLVIAVDEQDNLAEFRQNFPLDPINLESPWQTYDLLEINTARLSTWRQDLAKRVFAIWERRGAVWLPQRLFQQKPRPEWNWVEGDDSRVKWTDLPSFFLQFDTGTNVAGNDGFVLLQDTAKNRYILDQAGAHNSTTAKLILLSRISHSCLAIIRRACIASREE